MVGLPDMLEPWSVIDVKNDSHAYMFSDRMIVSGI